MLSLLVALAISATGSASVELQTRSGYDSNIFFGSAQDLADPALFGPARDAYVMVRPELGGALELGRVRLGAQYDLALTQYGRYAHGYFRVHRLTLSEELRIGAASIGLVELGDDYAISAFRSDRLQRGVAGLTGGLILGRWDLAARLEGGLRHFPFREIAYRVPEDDQLYAGTALARWSRGDWQLDGFLRGERRDSNALALAGDTEQLEVGAGFTPGAWDLDLRADVRRLALPDFPIDDFNLGRLDVQAGVHGLALYHWGSLSFGVETGYERNFSNYGLAQFKRFLAGVDVGWTWSWSPPPPRAAVQLPRQPGHYRLQVDLPGAKQVSVVGSFEGWKQPGVPLTETRPGHFVVELDLPPGRHRYQLVVDGARTTPPDADGYEPDGMGGMDGVLVVPGASDPGDVR